MRRKLGAQSTRIHGLPQLCQTRCDDSEALSTLWQVTVDFTSAVTVTVAVPIWAIEPAERVGRVPYGRRTWRIWHFRRRLRLSAIRRRWVWQSRAFRPTQKTLVVVYRLAHDPCLDLSATDPGDESAEDVAIGQCVILAWWRCFGIQYRGDQGRRIENWQLKNAKLNASIKVQTRFFNFQFTI